MIISISGRMGSGKDTVGSIIQYLTMMSINKECKIDYTEWCTPRGKATEFLGKDYWQIKKFAEKLKSIASLLTGIPIEMFEDQEFKKTFLPLEWGYLKDSTTYQLMTVRELLQKLGTEAMRNGLHENVWVNSLMADYKPDTYTRVNVTYIASNLPNWIITDTRFPNELDAVKGKEGVTIKVKRNWGSTENLFSTHPSETALDDATFDYEIVNDGTIEELIEKVRAILIELSII